MTYFFFIFLINGSLYKVLHSIKYRLHQVLKCLFEIFLCGETQLAMNQYIYVSAVYEHKGQLRKQNIRYNTFRKYMYSNLEYAFLSCSVRKEKYRSGRICFTSVTDYESVS